MDAEARFRLLVESVEDYAIFHMDPEGNVESWNRGAERIEGYSADEVIGKHFSLFYTPEDVAEDKCEMALELATAEGRYEEEGWRVRKDGTRFWANVVITVLRTPSGELVGFAKVTRDLTDRRRSEEENIRLAQAREAIRLRDDFLSIASHELKTPLTALQLQLQSLRERAKNVDEIIARRLDRAERSAHRLADVVEALLDVSRVSTGRFTLRPEKFDLLVAAREVVERLREAAAAADCEVSVVAPGALVGEWDRLRVEQIVTNFLSNAFKYGLGAPVELYVEREEGDAVIQVRDHGPGIADADVQRIFGRFERAASMRNFAGFGLGLYVTREIVVAHGGSVTVRNASDGGAVFTVRLPLERRGVGE